MDDQIKLAKAMGLEIFSRGADTYPLRKLHNNLMQPFTPLTDANDDCAVLEWIRDDSGFDDEAYAFAMLTVIEEQGGDTGHSFPMYRIGNYARAALMLLGSVEDQGNG